MYGFAMIVITNTHQVVLRIYNNSINKIDEDIELHRPYVDNITLSCPKCRKMSRVEEVIDVWFDSGSMPFCSASLSF